MIQISILTIASIITSIFTEIPLLSSLMIRLDDGGVGHNVWLHWRVAVSHVLAKLTGSWSGMKDNPNISKYNAYITYSLISY